MDATAFFKDTRLVPVVVIDDRDIGVDLAKLLVNLGMSSIEVTLRTDVALDVIGDIAEQVPEIKVGAGSVRHVSQFEEIIRRGAQFAVSPGSTPSLCEAAKAANLPLVPGAETASEMLALLEAGYELQKFFPAELAGGAKKLKALSAPIPDVKFFPTGGINEQLLPDYLALPCVQCVGGSWFLPSDHLREKNFAALEQSVKQAMALI